MNYSNNMLHKFNQNYYSIRDMTIQHKHNYTYLLSVKYQNYHQLFEDITDIFNAQRMYTQLMGSS